jgi:hypothetical protein
MARPLGRYQYFPENVDPKLPKDSAAEALPKPDEIDDEPKVTGRVSAPKKD